MYGMCRTTARFGSPSPSSLDPEPGIFPARLQFPNLGFIGLRDRGLVVVFLSSIEHKPALKVRPSLISRFSTALSALYAEADLTTFPLRVLAAVNTLDPTGVYHFRECEPGQFLALEIPSLFPLVLGGAGLAAEPGDPIASTAGNQAGSYPLCRAGKDFTAEEREVLSMLTPHILQALQSAATRSRVKELEMRCAAEAAGAAVMRFNPQGQVLWATRTGRSLLELHFPELQPRQIAPAILEWALSAMARSQETKETNAPSIPLHFGTPSRSLRIRLLPSTNPESFKIHLEAGELHPLGFLPGFGLTLRESEILAWIRKGKRNAEIGQILDITSKTVSKHAERIFAKLGVETRGAAANMELGVGI